MSQFKLSKLCSSLSMIVLLVCSLTICAQETRPSGNTGTGFFVKNGKIYDPTGIEFIPMGFNSSAYWGGNGECKRTNMSTHIPNAGANAVRIVTQTQGAFGWNANPTDQRDLVSRAVNAQIVPMLEMHDATCSNGNVQSIVNYWTSTAMVSICQDFEQYLWVNIANEHDFSTAEVWRDSYISYVQQMRNAGIKNLIVIDPGRNCGQRPDMVMQYGQQILNADPQHNIVFSVHMYAYWRTLDRTFTGWTPPFIVEETLPALKNAGLPVIVGEFGWDTPSGYEGNYSSQTVVQTCLQNNIGFYFWSFFDGDSKPYYNIVNNVCNGIGSGNLTPAGQYLIPFLQANAQTAAIFDPPTNSLNVSPSSLSFAPAGGNQNLTVTGTVSWTATDNAAWITLSPASGSGNGSITVTAAANTGSTSRSGTVTVSGGGFTRTVSVTQAAPGTEGPQTIQAENFSSNSGGNTDTAQPGYNGTGYFDMGGNGTWVQWTVNVLGGSYNLTFRYANGSTGNRTSTVTVNGGSATTQNFIPTGSWTTWINTPAQSITLNPGSNTIRVTAGAPGGPNIDELTISPAGPTSSLSVSPGSLTFNNSAGSQSVTVTSNVSWSVSDDQSWISVTPAVGTNNGTVTVTVTGNTTSATRTGTVTITGGSLTETVSVSQAGTSLPVNDTYQGEDFTSQSGGASRTDFGVTFYDFGGNGTWEEWNIVNVPSAGAYTLTLRYGNGSGANRQCALTVNGGAQGNIPFTSNTDWAVWQTTTTTVNLNSGNNTIRLTANTASGGPNLDYIQVSNSGGGGSARMVSPASELEVNKDAESRIFIYPNPVQRYLHIGGVSKPVEVKLYHVSGRYIKTIVTDGGENDVSELPSGFYLIKTPSRTIKMIKE